MPSPDSGLSIRRLPRRLGLSSMVPPTALVWRVALGRSAILGLMAYRLERGESVIKGLKRVVRDEMESASDCLSGKKTKQAGRKTNHAGKPTNRDEAIHGARKSIKKIRAVL